MNMTIPDFLSFKFWQFWPNPFGISCEFPCTSWSWCSVGCTKRWLYIFSGWIIIYMIAMPCKKKLFFLYILKINKHLQEHDLQKFVSCRTWSISLLALYKNTVGIFHFDFHLGPELHKKGRILRRCPVPPIQSRWQRCRTSDRSRSDWSRISTRGQAWYKVTYAVPCLSQTGASRPYVPCRTYNIHIVIGLYVDVQKSY